MNANPMEIDSSGLSRDLESLQRRIRHGAGRAVAEFEMIADGDRVMVCLSGGADSYTLLDVLLGLQKAAPIDFELVAVNLDQKQPGFPERVLPEYLESLGVEYRIVEEDTYSVVKRVIPEGKTTCSLCSRLRRGVLYNTASEIGATRIALGHHADDIVETAFLNMFFNSRLKAMPAKLRSDDGRHVVIRPLAYLREVLIKQYAAPRLWIFRSFPATCAARNPICSARRSRRCCVSGISAIPGGSTISSGRCAGSRRRTCSIASYTILAISERRASTDGVERTKIPGAKHQGKLPSSRREIN